MSLPEPSSAQHSTGHQNLVAGSGSQISQTIYNGAVPPAPARVPHELPPRAERFFGRETERMQLVERLRAGRNTSVVGPAGMGKTALAAEAVVAVVGETPATLAGSPYPDGVVFLDLYTAQGRAEPIWSDLANRLAGPGFLDRSPARQRAVEACRGRRFLLIVEGGEEANGVDGRATLKELLAVLSPENRRLLLTRDLSQASGAEIVHVEKALAPEEAAGLLDSLTGGRVPAGVRGRVLGLVQGHPLALTWAGGLLSRGDEDPEYLLDEWDQRPHASLQDPVEARHTLEWLFERSRRGLSETAKKALAAAGLLARAPFPLGIIEAALAGDPGKVDARAALRTLVQAGFLRLAGEKDCWEFTHVLGYGFARQETGSDPELRGRLAFWLRLKLQPLLTAGADPDPGALARLLEHSGALLRADEDVLLWHPQANYLLYDGFVRLVELGRLDLVQLALGAVEGWLDKLPATQAQEPRWARERSVLLESLGYVQQTQGDLAEALTAFQEVLTIRQHLAADPSNTERQRDLSIGHNKVGDVLRDQGDLAGALAAYRAGLSITERLATVDPSNTDLQRNLSISHDNVGDVLQAQSDLAGALAAYQAGLGIAERLAARDPTNTEWQRDLSISHNKVGNVLQAQGDLAGALEVYRADLAIAERLAAADPANAHWQRDLVVSLIRMAELHVRSGSNAEALEFARRGLPIAERLAALDPTNATWQKDLRGAHTLVARLRAGS